MSTRGIVYVATKDEKYAAEAFLSATSVKEIMPDLPITIFTNLTGSTYIQDDCFDEVVPIDTLKRYRSAWAEGQLDRILCLTRSPYDITLHLDSDTRMVDRDAVRVFSLLEDADIAMVECETDNSYSRREYPARMFNVGFILFRRSGKTNQLFDAWAELTAEHFRVASLDPMPELDCMSRITDEAVRRRLLFMDQISLVQMCSPDVNRFDLRIRILHESWNYRGSATNRPLTEPLRISHHPAMRKVALRDIGLVAQRYQQLGNFERALQLYRDIEKRIPTSPELVELIEQCESQGGGAP